MQGKWGKGGGRDDRDRKTQEQRERVPGPQEQRESRTRRAGGGGESRGPACASPRVGDSRVLPVRRSVAGGAAASLRGALGAVRV